MDVVIADLRVQAHLGEEPVEDTVAFVCGQSGMVQGVMDALQTSGVPRESRLEPMADGQLRRLWGDPRIVDLADAGPAAFSSGARGDLREPLLWLALICGLGEVVLASVPRGRA